MGLTIHYSLDAGTRPLPAVRQTLAALHTRAAALSFRHVSPLIDLAGADCLLSGPNDPHAWLKVQVLRYPQPPTPPHIAPGLPGETPPNSDHPADPLPPRRILAFSIDPARGSEQANFGFCAYPAGPTGQRRSRTRAQRRAPSRLPTWSWSSFCKTQYASNPTLGGLQNFLQAHLGLIRLLDYAQELGVLASVLDEGRYWEHRNTAALLREVGAWNKMIAAGYGVIRDAIESTGGNPNALQAPIAGFPDFEYLEAKGRLI